MAVLGSTGQAAVPQWGHHKEDAAGEGGSSQLVTHSPAGARQERAISNTVWYDNERPSSSLALRRTLDSSSSLSGGDALTAWCRLASIQGPGLFTPHPIQAARASPAPVLNDD